LPLLESWAVHLVSGDGSREAMGTTIQDQVIGYCFA
jgi:hypothetical protein